jgi:hypothetical protein
MIIYTPFALERRFSHAKASLSAESFIDSVNKMLSIPRAHKFYIGTSVKFMPPIRMEMLFPQVHDFSTPARRELLEIAEMSQFNLRVGSTFNELSPWRKLHSICIFFFWCFKQTFFHWRLRT